MESGDDRFKLSLKLDQERPPKKKGLWRKIKEFFTQGQEGKDSEDWRSRNPSDW